MCSSDLAAAGRLAGRWAWPTVIAILLGMAGGWLDPAAAIALLNGPTATIDTQATEAQNPVVSLLLQRTGASPFAVFPLLAVDSGRLARAAELNPLLLAWLVTDAGFEAHVVHGAQWQPWANTLVRGNQEIGRAHV
mgnify:FL=1